MLAPSSRPLLPFALALAGLAPALAQEARAQPARPQEESPRFIVDVTVVDVEAGALLSSRTVALVGERIASVLPSAEAEVPDGASVVDGRGRFLIPGLVDAHVHLSAAADAFPALLVAHGVTTVRDTGADTAMIVALRERARGDALLPRIVCTGAIVDGDPAFWPFSHACGTPDEAREAVRALAEARVDQIKVYSFLKKDVYAAAVEEAHRLGLKATGHVPTAVSLQEALALGQDCNEHLTGFDRALARLLGRPAPERPDPFRGEFDAWFEYGRVDRERLAALCAEVRAAGMVQCPTLVVMHGMTHAAAPQRGDADARMAYVPVQLRSFWKRGGYDEFGRAVSGALESMHALVGELHRAGVPLMVGTDLANPYVFPGSSVHEELACFQEAGIPAADALRAATIVPARFMGLDGELGSVAAGKEASLVLLRADPLADVTNTAAIEGVFLRGRYLDRARLDALAAEVASAVAGDEEPADAAAAGVALELPGEVVARGRYGLKFGQFDAGSEDFVITEDERGFHVRAHNRPKGGPQRPFVLELHADKDFAFVSARYEELTEQALVAEYTRRGDVVEVAARRGDETFTQSFELPAGAVVSGPTYATELLSFAAADLAPGASRTYPSVGFGFAEPTWRLQTVDVTLKRLEDGTLAHAGAERAVRRYSASMTLPFGEFRTDSFTDESGLLLRSRLVMPFGTVTAELEPDAR